jgi:anti-sigma factor RsiW
MRFWADHRWTPPHMSAYLDDELSPARRSRFERHESECAQCRTLLAGLRAMLEALHGVARPDGGAQARELATSVRQRLNEPPGAS